MVALSKCSKMALIICSVPAEALIVYLHAFNA